MAPGLVETIHYQSRGKDNSVSRSIFPDGIKTSGQHPPIFKELKPYDSFPTEIIGPTAWSTDDYRDRPEKWTHRFTAEEIEEMSEAADNFRAAEIPLTGISQVFQ